MKYHQNIIKSILKKIHNNQINNEILHLYDSKSNVENLYSK